MILRDKLGWPVEFYKNRPITNIIRALLHTNIKQSYRYYNYERTRNS